MPERSAQALTIEDIDLALAKLSAESRQKRPGLRFALAVAIGSTFWLAIGAGLTGIALAIQRSVYMWVGWGLALVLFLAYSLGKRFIPESAFDFSSTFLDRLKHMGLSKQQADDLARKHGLFSNLSCLSTLFFIVVMYACMLSWPALEVWSIIKGEAPVWLWGVAILTLLMAGIILTVNEIKKASYFQELLQMKDFFTSLRETAQASGEAVEVGEEALAKFKKVESEQRLREARQAIQEANFVSQEEIERKFGFSVDDSQDAPDAGDG